MISSQGALRALAIQRDAEAVAVFELRILWEHLCHGAWVFHDTFSTSERCYAVLRSPQQPLPPGSRKLAMLESLLLGHAVKVVAMDFRRSQSSVTGAVQDCLRALGLGCRPSHTPVLLTMAAMAMNDADGASASLRGRLSRLRNGDDEYVVISALRPDLYFPVRLSSAEAAVLRSLVAGQTHAQISGERARSPRTVANQLAGAFRKLGVSGRRATLGVLIQHSARVG